MARREREFLRKLYWRFFDFCNSHSQRAAIMNLLHRANVNDCQRRKQLVQQLQVRNKIVEGLAADGYYICPPDETPDTSEAISWLRDWYSEFAARESDKISLTLKQDQLYFHKKRFNLRELSPLDQSPVIRLALDPEILGSVSHYLGYLPFVGIHSRFTILSGKSPPQASLKRTSFAHLDWRDNTMLRMYMNAIDGNRMDGVLHVLNAEDSQRLRDSVNYRYAKSHTSHHLRRKNGLFLSDEIVDRYVPRNRWIPLRGPAGSLSLVDTSRCFHFASRASSTKQGSRLNLVFNFVRPCALALHGACMPRDIEEDHLQQLSEIQRLAFVG